MIPIPPQNRCAPEALKKDTPNKEVPKNQGIALLMALTVTMLLAFFMSEFFFATGLELQGMTTFKEGEKARTLSRSVFRVTQIGLLQDEVDFFSGYNQIKELLTFSAVPWKDGLLLQLDILPQDHLYNLNEVGRIRQGGAQEQGRWFIFQNLMENVRVPSEIPDTEPEPPAPEVVAGLYAAFVDFIDSDDEEYIQFPAIRGAEMGSYFNFEPEIEIKNGMLDRLDEIRLVQGIAESKIPWAEFESRLTTLPRAGEGKTHLSEKININTASQEEILEFLEDRRIEPADVGGFSVYQAGVNKYIDDADRIAEFFAPEEEGQEREAYTPATLKNALKNDLKFTDNYGINYLFSTVNEYYRIRIVTEVNEVQSSLEAMLHVTRDKNTRIGTSSSALWVSLR